MNIVFYIIIFIVGALLGGLCARAVQRITKGKKIFESKSYCPKCGEKLGFFEKIPILSYIFLRGKCKHCKKPIDKKYIILEILTGIALVSLGYSLKLNIERINIVNFITFIFITLYFAYVLIAAGIDRKSRNMSASLLAYGNIISLLYVVYLCIVEKTMISMYIMYLLIMAILIHANVVSTQKHAQSSYVLDLLNTILIMLTFTNEVVCILSIELTLLAVALYILTNRVKLKEIRINKNKTKFSTNVNILYILGNFNIMIFLILINILR